MPRSTRHLVDPELLPAIEPCPPMDDPIESLPTARAESSKLLASTPIRSDLPVRCEELRARGPAGAPDVRVLCYRLAPEHPYPAPLEDCYAALKWLHEQSDALGVDRSRVVVKGESAGGGLAAALALLARDRGGPPISFQHLTYPMLDDRTCIDPDFRRRSSRSARSTCSSRRTSSTGAASHARGPAGNARLSRRVPWVRRRVGRCPAEDASLQYKRC